MEVCYQLFKKKAHVPILFNTSGNSVLASFRAGSSNLGGIIEGACVLLIGMRLPPDYGSAYDSCFRQVLAKLAGEHNTALLSFLLEGGGEAGAVSGG